MFKKSKKLIVSLISIALGSSCLVSRGMEYVSNSYVNENVKDITLSIEDFCKVENQLKELFFTYCMKYFERDIENGRMKTGKSLTQETMNNYLNVNYQGQDFFNYVNSVYAKNNKKENMLPLPEQCNDVFSESRYIYREDCYEIFLKNILEAVHKCQKLKEIFRIKTPETNMGYFNDLLDKDCFKILATYLNTKKLKYVEVEIQSPKFKKPYGVICFLLSGKVKGSVINTWRVVDTRFIFKGKLLKWMDRYLDFLSKKAYDSNMMIDKKYSLDGSFIINNYSYVEDKIKSYMKIYNIPDVYFKVPKDDKSKLYGRFAYDASEYFKTFIKNAEVTDTNGNKQILTGSIKINGTNNEALKKEFKTWCQSEGFIDCLKED